MHKVLQNAEKLAKTIEIIINLWYNLLAVQIGFVHNNSVNNKQQGNSSMKTVTYHGSKEIIYEENLWSGKKTPLTAKNSKNQKEYLPFGRHRICIERKLSDLCYADGWNRNL